jgi:hypothetical protein
MNLEYVNSFECTQCDYWEEQPVDQQRHHMSAELIAQGQGDEKFGLYKCPVCNTESWSKVTIK